MANAVTSPEGLLIGAALGAALLTWRLVHNRRLKAQEATLSFIIEAGRDPGLLAAREAFRAVVARSVEVQRTIAGGESDDALRVATYLNHFETAAIGVRYGILSRSMYLEYAKGTLLRVWDRAEPYIRLRRDAKGDGTFYENFERLVADIRLGS